MKFKQFFCLLFASLLLGYSFPSSAQLAANLKAHISYLASDNLHGRMTGSEDERKAASYIIEQFKKDSIANCKGNFKTGKYLQAFHFHPKMDSVRKKIAGNNVV